MLYDMTIKCDCRWYEDVVATSPEEAYKCVANNIDLDDKDSFVGEVFCEHVENDNGDYFYLGDREFGQVSVKQKYYVSVVVRFSYSAPVEADSLTQAQTLATEKFECVDYPSNLEFVDWDFET